MRQQVALYWDPPHADAVKLNVDGRCTSIQVMAARSLIRDTNGKWLIGFTLNIGTGKPLVEIWALYLGLCLAWRYGYLTVYVELDSTEVVNLNHTGWSTFHPFAILLTKCRQLMDSNWHCKLSHVYREVNVAAHSLATMGQYHTWGLQILNAEPLNLPAVLRNDCNQFPMVLFIIWCDVLTLSQYFVTVYFYYEHAAPPGFHQK